MFIQEAKYSYAKIQYYWTHAVTHTEGLHPPRDTHIISTIAGAMFFIAQKTQTGR